MQATVASYDADAHSGVVVTDQGESLEFTATALADHIRHLRPGQRVHVNRDGAADGSGITGIRLWL